MTKPKVYEPEQGYKYQIFCKESGESEWEHCDYAENSIEKNYLVNEYQMAYGAGFVFKSIRLPQKYWKEL